MGSTSSGESMIMCNFSPSCCRGQMTQCYVIMTRDEEEQV
ncbi:hypothetical protein PRUPE_2G107800 [Prunus persica]|uniref:Uncharacterized protein n=1 Tax=Prunus persica TaxID=3760 RepID=A0A251QFE0_PRUPE|nr:hypothetical protein PRUPE_2G107800 [Prunus persica]